MAGYFTNGMDTLETALTGAERIAGDTNLSSGENPASVGIAPAMLAAGATQLEVPLTGFTIQADAGVTRVLLKPAGTLATGTFTFPAAPFEGQEIHLSSTQTQTAITVAAPSGYTIVGAAVTALVAVTEVIWVHIGTVWYRVR